MLQRVPIVPAGQAVHRRTNVHQDARPGSGAWWRWDGLPRWAGGAPGVGPFVSRCTQSRDTGWIVQQSYCSTNGVGPCASHLSAAPTQRSANQSRSPRIHSSWPTLESGVRTLDTPPSTRRLPAVLTARGRVPRGERVRFEVTTNAPVVGARRERDTHDLHLSTVRGVRTVQFYPP